MLKLSKIGVSITTSVLKLVSTNRKLYYTTSPVHLGEGFGLRILGSNRDLWTVHLFLKGSTIFLLLVTKYSRRQAKL